MLGGLLDPTNRSSNVTAGCTEMAKFLSWLIVCLMFDVSLQFVPTMWWDLAVDLLRESGSKTHQSITEQAIDNTALRMIMDELAPHPTRRSAPKTKSYREAMKQFEDAVAEPDSSAKEKYDPKAHFDDEQFAESIKRIANLRNAAITAIRKGNMETARNLFGRALHTLQDFYSHSNWVELGNTDPHPGFDFSNFTGPLHERIPLRTVAGEDQTTCIDCDRFL